MFFMGITIMFLLFLVVISLGVFLSSPKKASTLPAFNKPKINIDMSVFDSTQFKNLQPLPGMLMQFSYKAETKDKKIQAGIVYADSMDDAKAILEGRGLTVTALGETEIGRDNPFTPYYQTSAAASSASVIQNKGLIIKK